MASWGSFMYRQCSTLVVKSWDFPSVCQKFAPRVRTLLTCFFGGRGQKCKLHLGSSPLAEGWGLLIGWFDSFTWFHSSFRWFPWNFTSPHFFTKQKTDDLPYWSKNVLYLPTEAAIAYIHSKSIMHRDIKVQGNGWTSTGWSGCGFGDGCVLSWVFFCHQFGLGWGMVVCWGASDGEFQGKRLRMANIFCWRVPNVGRFFSPDPKNIWPFAHRDEQIE